MPSPEPVANEVRGEVDLILDHTRFVLRPSYEAVLAVEKETGKGLIALATAATDGALGLSDAALITAEFIRAWGRSVEDPVARAVDTGKIGELIHEYGLMRVTLRLAMVLTLAATGGCKNDGSPKEGEAQPTTEMSQPVVGASQGSRAQRSAGRRASTGNRPRTSSGGLSKSSKK
jgi:hypothetical protein